jgi:hypothetical protein
VELLAPEETDFLGPETPKRPKAVKSIIVRRDVAEDVLANIKAAVEAAYPRAQVHVARPGIFGEVVVIAPVNEAVEREVQQLADEVIARRTK